MGMVYIPGTYTCTYSYCGVVTRGLVVVLLRCSYPVVLTNTEDRGPHSWCGGGVVGDSRPHHGYLWCSKRVVARGLVVVLQCNIARPYYTGQGQGTPWCSGGGGGGGGGGGSGCGGSGGGG
jgi:hypothetical protein